MFFINVKHISIAATLFYELIKTNISSNGSCEFKFCLKQCLTSQFKKIIDDSFSKGFSCFYLSDYYICTLPINLKY